MREGCVRFREGVCERQSRAERFCVTVVCVLERGVCVRKGVCVCVRERWCVCERGFVSDRGG